MKALKLCIAMLPLCASGALASQTYSLVQGIDKFDGSPLAWRLLETNGFVVADPVYKQMFEPYLDTSLPPFITTDSAWDAYQVLLAAGVKQLESDNSPAADFFANTIESKIPGRAIASGLDFWVASPGLRSPAAARALGQMSGDKAKSALENLNYPLASNSLAAQSLRLLATLQKPVPDSLAPAFRSQAWADEQLWAQLGAWIELNHRRQLHSGIFEGFEATEDAPKKGVVAPYPDFFAGLAQLARDTGAAMEKAGMDEPFDTRAIAQRLLDGIFVQQDPTADKGEEMAKMSKARIQFRQFAGHYMEAHHAGGGENSPADQQLLKDFEAVARRCLAGTLPSADDRAVLQSLFDERLTAPRLMGEFATNCDVLAELARKHLNGKPLTGEDEKWIAGYGATLARFHFFSGNSSAGAEDDFPIITRLGATGAGSSALWAGLGHPEALYIILPAEGRLRLYRGAVLAYREFVAEGSETLDDKSWRERVESGNIPPPPSFTAVFRSEKSAADILETLAAEADDSQAYRDIQGNLETLQTRVHDSDLPALIAMLAKSDGAWSGSPIPGGIASAIGKLNWKLSQKNLLALVDKDGGARASTVASILLQRPEWLDGAGLAAFFDGSSARSRRVYALLLGRLPPGDRTRAALLRASRDDAPAVRWQAALAIGRSSWEAAQKIPPLLDRLNDTNEMVAAVAARGLGTTGTSTVGPVLFSNLEQHLAAPPPAIAAFEDQVGAVQDNVLGIINGQWSQFDPDNLVGRAQMSRIPRFSADGRREPFTLDTALIEGLGDLRYKPAADKMLELLAGRNAIAAARALKQIAPEKLTARLVTIANDKNALPQARDHALLLLSDTAGANPMADLIPLLDDRTIVPGNRMMAGREWRICDRAAATIGALMGRTVRMAPMMPAEQRDQQIEQVRQWLKSAY